MERDRRVFPSVQNLWSSVSKLWKAVQDLQAQAGTHQKELKQLHVTLGEEQFCRKGLSTSVRELQAQIGSMLEQLTQLHLTVGTEQGLCKEFSTRLTTLHAEVGTQKEKIKQLHVSALTEQRLRGEVRDLSQRVQGLHAQATPLVARVGSRCGVGLLLVLLALVFLKLRYWERLKNWTRTQLREFLARMAQESTAGLCREVQDLSKVVQEERNLLRSTFREEREELAELRRGLRDQEKLIQRAFKSLDVYSVGESDPRGIPPAVVPPERGVD